MNDDDEGENNNNNNNNGGESLQQGKKNFSSDDDDKKEGEKKNKKQKFTIGSIISPWTKFSDIELPEPSNVVTSIERDYRRTEINLLLQLKFNNDKPISNLWTLWFSEKGPIAKKELNACDALMTNPTDWTLCETKLLKLIDEYGVYFTEPMNRLATLYHLQGRLGESYKLCQIILS